MDKIGQALRGIDQEIDFINMQLQDLFRERGSIPWRIFTEEYRELTGYKKDLYEARDIIEAFRMLE